MLMDEVLIYIMTLYQLLSLCCIDWCGV